MNAIHGADIYMLILNEISLRYYINMHKAVFIAAILLVQEVGMADNLHDAGFITIQSLVPRV